MAHNLFSPILVGSIFLKNRIVMAPLTRCRAGPSHLPNDLMKEYYTQRASAGLIITEATMIAPNTSTYTGEPGIYNDEQVQGWKQITDAVHAKGGKIVLQLWHAGRAAHPLNNNGVDVVSPSAIAAQGEAITLQGKKPYTVPRALTVDEIQSIVQQFATAAKTSIHEAGFDGVEVLCANGYLLDQFLHSCANSRTDQYGGSLENRSRFLVEVLDAVTKAVGADKVGARFATLGSGGWTDQEDVADLSEHLAKIAQRFDLAYAHILRRDYSNVLTGDVEPIFRRHFKNVVISNMGYTRDDANAAIEEGRVDAVSFGSLFVANPDLPERFKEGAELNMPDYSKYFASGPEGYTDYPALS
ncbi:unnamed protein product [Aphanomyces euteiches]|uniref:NADH:flavin oxidoreductase/NADH oxidase N-terminal domain-containing protein n=1 Tax=Aphanomyces euteiches TaxID=100861 RepID=A0A6G0XEW2_9STRA|nr:hypothetical protein Ae201684_005542 [Aphanomyces euteiches]KAH9078603.1 hypothetical protein Ae201684P_019683 [Aphanomyces euteiches]KAH9143046.1 hypothetical protein AeRB84_012927 [Aphanomyces euteiches]